MGSVDLENDLGHMDTSRDRDFVGRRRSVADELLNQRKAFSTEEGFFGYLRTKVETRIPRLSRRS